MKEMKVGNKVQVEFRKGIKTILYIQAKTENEILAIGAQSAFASMQTFPQNKIVVSTIRDYQGIKLKAGDKILVVTPEQKSLPMYITHFIDNDSFVLSKNKKDSGSTVNWLLRLLKQS